MVHFELLYVSLLEGNEFRNRTAISTNHVVFNTLRLKHPDVFGPKITDLPLLSQHQGTLIVAHISRNWIPFSASNLRTPFFAAKKYHQSCVQTRNQTPYVALQCFFFQAENLMILMASKFDQTCFKILLRIILSTFLCFLVLSTDTFHGKRLSVIWGSQEKILQKWTQTTPWKKQKTSLFQVYFIKKLGFGEETWSILPQKPCLINSIGPRWPIAFFFEKGWSHPYLFAEKNAEQPN